MNKPLNQSLSRRCRGAPQRASSALAAVVALAISGAAHAGSAATEAQWVAAAAEAVAYGKAQGLAISLEVQAGDGLPGHTPVGIASEGGRCTLIVSARNNPTADKVSAMIAPELMDVFLTGAAIHEVGHCHRRLQGYPHNEKLLPVVAWIAPVREWFDRRVRTEEAYADMTTVAWLARYHPDRYTTVLSELLRVRTRFLEAKHDTLPWLETALADGAQTQPEASDSPARNSDGNLFALAEQRMARVR